MAEAFICRALRAPIGRCGGALATVRADAPRHCIRCVCDRAAIDAVRA